MQVEEVMTRDVVRCRPGDTFGEVIRQMWEEDCGSVVVVDSSNRVAGMVTDRDVCMCLFFEDARPIERSVEHAMSHAVKTCQASDSLERALEIMSTNQVRRLPVVDPDERVVGVISLNDLVRACDGSAGIDPETLVHAMAEICAPREHDYAEVVGTTSTVSGLQEVDYAR